MGVATNTKQTSSSTASWMVACAPQLQLPDASQYMQVPSAVDQLKQQLLLAVENGDPVGATDVLSNLEKAPLTKEILEATRIGAAVNDIRKRTSSTFPDLSKKCRVLIKGWQKLLDNRPSSSNGTISNGGTPNTPAIRRGLTPQTPGRKVNTPGRAQIASPGLGELGSGYAPKTTIVSPKQEGQGQLPKSHSVGSELCRSDSRASSKTASPSVRVAKKRPLEKIAEVEIGTTEKRPCVEEKRNQTPSTSPSAVHVSTLAARRQNALPTSNLVAQLSDEPIPPQSLGKSSNTKPVEDNKRRSEQPEVKPFKKSVSSVFASSPAALTNGVSSPRPAVRPVVKPAVKQPVHSVTSNTAKEADKKKERKIKFLKPSSSKPKQSCEDDFFYASDGEDEKKSRAASEKPKTKKSWYSTVPTTRELAGRIGGEVSTQKQDLRKTSTLPKNRDFLVLPYADVGLPDFREFRFKDPKRFIASSDLVRR